MIAVHASNSSQIRVEFTLDAPRRAVFSPPAFKPLEPFASSGSYLDSVGRDYYPQLNEGRQRVSITWGFLHTEDPISIAVE